MKTTTNKQNIFFGTVFGLKAKTNTLNTHNKARGVSANFLSNTHNKKGLMSLFLGALFLVFSGYVGAVGDMIGCDADDRSIESYNKFKRINQNNPGNTAVMFTLGIRAFCLNRIQEGMAYMQRASDNGHVSATKVVADYYYSDGTFSNANGITKDQKNYDATIYYYERAAEQIESAPNYPKGVNEDQDSLENENRTSAYVFTQLPFIYYRGYVSAIMEILNSSQKLLYEDSVAVLEKMQDSANRCLRMPALYEWHNRRERTHRAMQLQCQARRDFASQAIDLERERIRVARDCSGPLSDCPKHKEIVGQLVNLSNIMGDRVRSAKL